MAGLFSFFGGGPSGSGGIEHSGGGKATPLPTNSPQQQLSTGTPTPTGTQTQTPTPTPDPLNSHLEELASVWKTATTADGKPIAPQADPLAQQLFSFKQEDVINSAKTLDFTKSVNPELATKALAGDAAALQQYVNETVQTAFAAMTLNTGNLMNDGFLRHGKAFDAALPTRLRNHEVATRQSDDPVLSHPAVAPIMIGLKATIAQQQPGLSAEQIQTAAENYVKGLSGAFNLKDAQVTTKKEEAGATDWLRWANMEQG